MVILIRKIRKGDGKGIAAVFNEGMTRGICKYTGSNRPCTAEDAKAIDKMYSRRTKKEFGFVALDGKEKSLALAVSMQEAMEDLVEG